MSKMSQRKHFNQTEGRITDSRKRTWNNLMRGKKKFSTFLRILIWSLYFFSKIKQPPKKTDIFSILLRFSIIVKFLTQKISQFEPFFLQITALEEESVVNFEKPRFVRWKVFHSNFVNSNQVSFPESSNKKIIFQVKKDKKRDIKNQMCAIFLKIALFCDYSLILQDFEKMSVFNFVKKTLWFHFIDFN